MYLHQWPRLACSRECRLLGPFAVAIPAEVFDPNLTMTKLSVMVAPGAEANKANKALDFIEENWLHALE